MRSFRQRHIPLIVCVILTVTVVAGFYFPPIAGARFSVEVYERIELGMSRQTAIELLGPPGDYFTLSQGYYFVNGEWLGPSEHEGEARAPWSSELRWNGDNGGIKLQFDAKNRVVTKWYYRPNPHRRWYGIILGE
jgi:hypothetical protein